VSTASLELPRATALAVTVVTAVGLAALAAPRPAVGAGALAGVAVAVAVRGMGRSPWWTGVAAAALPLGAFGLVVTLWLPSSVSTLALTVLAVVIGFSLVGVVAGRLGGQQIELVAASAVVNFLALLSVDLLTATGSVTTAAVDLLSVTNEGVGGLAVWLLAASAVTAVTAVLLPTAMTASLRGQPLELPRDSGVPVVAVGTTAALAVGLSVGVLIPGVEVVVNAVAASTVVRAAVVGVTLVMVVAGAVAVLSRAAWFLGRVPSMVPLGVGSLTGAVAVAALATGVGGGSESTTDVLVPTAMCVLAIGGIAALVADRFDLEGPLTRSPSSLRRFNRNGQFRSPGTSGGPALLSLPFPGWEQFGPGRLLPLGLIGGAVVVALEMDRALAFGQVGVLVAVASALFVRALVARGRTAARVVGVENVATVPQAVWVGWTGALAVVGLVVGVLGIVLADVLTVALSAPAAAGVVLALLALVAGIGSLVR
jgi:hypothetical protein